MAMVSIVTLVTWGLAHEASVSSVLLAIVRTQMEHYISLNLNSYLSLNLW